MREKWKEGLRQTSYFVTLLGALNFYIFGIFTIFCLATGRITREKVVIMAEVLRGRITGEKPAPELIQKPEERDAMRERLRREIETELTTRQREAESILSRAGQIRGDLEQERRLAREAAKDLADQRAAFEAQIRAEFEKRSSTEFAQNVKWFSTMEPVEASKILAEMPLEDILRYLRAIKDRTATELIVALAAEYDQRDLRDGTTMAAEFRKMVAELPAAMVAGVGDATPAAGGAAPR